jgi:hypothetical protein
MVVSQFIGSAQGNRVLQTQEPKRRLEMPIVARFAEVASNPMRGFTSMRSQGGALKLLNLTKTVRDLLRITKLNTVSDITDDEATSVKSFSPVAIVTARTN